MLAKIEIIPKDKSKKLEDLTWKDVLRDCKPIDLFLVPIKRFNELIETVNRQEKIIKDLLEHNRLEVTNDTSNSTN